MGNLTPQKVVELMEDNNCVITVEYKLNGEVQTMKVNLEGWINLVNGFSPLDMSGIWDFIKDVFDDEDSASDFTNEFNEAIEAIKAGKRVYWHGTGWQEVTGKQSNVTIRCGPSGCKTGYAAICG